MKNINISELFKINKDSPVPLYFQLKQAIKERIEDNTFKIDDQLPTELEFCQALDISRPTIRQALSELLNEGYISRRKAKGTFVSKPKVEGFFFKKLESYNDEMRSLGLTPKTNVLCQETIKGDDIICNNLKIKNNSKVLHLERLRYADDEVMVYVNTYVPLYLFDGIQYESFKDGYQSLYTLFKDNYQRPIAYVDRSIEAINASKKMSELLNVEKGAALYIITTIAYDCDDTPIEYSKAYYRGDRNKFSIRLVQQ